MSDETPPAETPPVENQPKTDMDKITEMLDARMRPLEEKLNATEKENKTLREQLINQDNKIKQQEEDINNYRSNLIMSSGAPKYNEVENVLANKILDNLTRGLEIAWRKSGNSSRPNLKDEWMKLAQNEILRYYEPVE